MPAVTATGTPRRFGSPSIVGVSTAPTRFDSTGIGTFSGALRSVRSSGRASESGRTPSGISSQMVPANRPSLMFDAFFASFADHSTSGVTKSIAPASPAPFLRNIGM